jgi:hypothetical protein
VARAHQPQGARVALPAEQVLPRHQLPQHDGEGEDVGARVDLLRVRLLGRHVGELALEDARRGVDHLVGGLGDAEVDQLHVPVAREQHVVRRDVAVDDLERPARGVLRGVRVVEAAGDLHPDAQRELEGNLVAGSHRALHQVAQIAPLDPLHRDEPGALGLAELEDAHDVGVEQPRGDPHLLQQQAEEARVFDQVGEDSLHHHRLAPAGHPGEKHLAHAARSQATDQLERTERCQAPEN